MNAYISNSLQVGVHIWNPMQYMTHFIFYILVSINNIRIKDFPISDEIIDYS